MDRNIVYPGSIPLDTDLLTLNRNAMQALGGLIAATLGQGSVIDGLSVTPVTAGLGVVVAPGSITQLASLDQNAYGSLPAQLGLAVMKMGLSPAAQSFAFAAPTGSGQAVTYLIQASFAEFDTDATVLPYYNAANPAQPFLGPANSGAVQPTLRQQIAQLQLKAGAPGIVGSQATPPVDAGWIGLAVVTVRYGQTQTLAGDIVPFPNNAEIPFRLPQLRPGMSALQTFGSSGSFAVPNGVTRLKVTVIGGGGAGGTHASQPGGGGGAGGQAVAYLSGLVPSTVIPVTVGAFGAASSVPGNGGGGGTSSFGSYVSATGGLGGAGGTANANSAGGAGGLGVGGDVNFAGSWGSDGNNVSGHGGDGGGPGNGRGTTGQTEGVTAPGFGGGGGGGGASGTGIGAAGGNGAPGLVTVEY